MVLFADTHNSKLPTSPAGVQSDVQECQGLYARNWKLLGQSQSQPTLPETAIIHSIVHPDRTSVD